MCLCDKESTTTQHYHLRCDFYSIYRLELLTDICALTHSLKNILEENLLKVLLYGAVEFSFNINSETLQCTKKFIKKQIGLLAHYFFLSFLNSPLIKYLVFNVFHSYFMNNLCTKFALAVKFTYFLYKFVVLCCLILLLSFSIALQLVSRCIL